MVGKSLSICHLGKFYPPAPGGIETHVQTLARGQAALGARVRVVCINHANRVGRDVTWSRYGATDTVTEDDGAVEVTRLGRSASFARLDVVPELPKLLSALQCSDIDIFHLHMPNPTMLLAAASLRLTVPLVITHHSDVIRQRLLRWFYRPFERLIYERAAAIACSSAGYVDGSPLLQQHVEKVELLPMGLDLCHFTDPSERALQHAAQLRRRYGQTIWLCVGRCVYYKGLHTAIEALAKVPGTLIVIGRGPLEQELCDHARRLGVDDRVVWWGYANMQELIGAYLAATALWFPSSHRSEAFGLVQVEAMAAGCPVINTKIDGSGVAWVSRHEESGLTIPVNDPHALAAAANRLLNDRELHSRLAPAARNRALRDFDHHMMAQRSLEIYDRAAARGKKRLAAKEPTRPGLSRWVRDMDPDALDLEQTTEVS